MALSQVFLSGVKVLALTYLDYMASTPLCEPALQAMLPFLQQHNPIGNPSSHSHGLASKTRSALNQAAQQVADAIGATADSIIWTSGATESNNLAIKGVADFYQRKGKHIVTMACEHKAVIEPCKALERQGYEVTFLKPQSNGVLSLDSLKAALRPDTVLVSIMQVNNETGIVQDIAAISQLVHRVGALLHVDGAQSVGKLPVDVKQLGVDLMTLSAHKAYGPLGVGALYIRPQPQVRLAAQLHGGQHQGGLRSGTVPLHQVVAMGAAFQWVTQQLTSNIDRLVHYRDYLWRGLQVIGGIRLNGDLSHQVPHCLNVSFSAVHMDALLLAMRDFVVSTGSSCNAALNQPSHVLQAMGTNEAQARQAMRISFGYDTTQQELDLFLDQCAISVKRLRAIAPSAS